MTLAAALTRLAGLPRLLVACDYDGTLAPLVSDPAGAYPVPQAIDALGGLARLPDTFVALISGRALTDLAALSGLVEPVHLVGSHGAEWSTGSVEGMDARRRELLEGLTAALTAIAGRFDGVAVETKPASAVLHVRNAARPDAAAALAELGDGPLTWPGLHVTRGKEVVEIAVVPTDKGAALATLRSSLAVDAVLFVGDDVTDEDAFARLSDPDVGVKVGVGETRAAYRIAAPADVAQLLADLLALR
ncbi:hypothetical protein BH20ACT5_BH20ACT5_00890 [soil metagenome]